MKAVRRKTPQSLSLTWRVIGIVVLMALILGLILWLKPFAWQRKPPVVASEPDTSKLLFTASEEELLSFTIHPRQGESYTILRENKAYRLASDADFPLDSGMIRHMVDAILYLEVSDTLTDLKDELDHLDEFGLLQGALRVSADFADGRKLMFAIGDRSPFEVPRDYLMMTGDSHLYAIPSDVREALDYRVNLLHSLPAINFSPDLLDSLVIQSADGTLQLQRLAQDLWELREPFIYPADMNLINQMLTQVKGMRFAAFVAEGSEENLRRYGLETPRYSVQMHLPASTISAYPDEGGEPIVTQVPAQVLRFDIGNNIEHLGFYCLFRGTIYQASDLSMGFMLNHQPEPYLSRAPFDIPMNQISEISFSSATGNQNFAISLVEQVLPNNELARDEAGNVLHNYLVRLGDREIDPEPLAQAYAKLMRLSASGRLPADYALDAKAALLTVTTKAYDRSRIISFYPFDALNAAMMVNGQVRDYVPLDRLMPLIDEISAIAD